MRQNISTRRSRYIHIDEATHDSLTINLQEQTGTCADLGTRGPHITSAPLSCHLPARHRSSSSLTTPLIDIRPPSPEPQEASPDFFSDLDDSFDLCTPSDSDCGRDVTQLEDLYPYEHAKGSCRSFCYWRLDGTDCCLGIDDATPCGDLGSASEVEDYEVMLETNPFGSSAELASATSAEDVLDDDVDDEAQEAEARSDSDGKVLASSLCQLC